MHADIIYHERDHHDHSQNGYILPDDYFQSNSSGCQLSEESFWSNNTSAILLFNEENNLD